MNFLSWHYSLGLEYYINRLTYSLKSLNHYFSLPILLPTLFSPWKRLIEIDTGSGFNFARYLQVTTFNFVSRFIGAIVRSILFIIGTLALASMAIIGIIGLLLWIIFPFLSLAIYQRFTHNPQNISKALANKSLSEILNSEPGKYLVTHLGIDATTLIEKAITKQIKINKSQINSFSDLIKAYLTAKTWSDSLLRQLKLTKDDFILAASQWDKIKNKETSTKVDFSFARPGLGLDLLFGYTPFLKQYSEDLSLPQSFSHNLVGRGKVVDRMKRSFTSGKNALIIGPPGVGKKTIVLEFAKRAIHGELGKDLSYTKILDFDYNFVFSETTDINQKKANLKRALTEAALAGNIILLVRNIHRLTNAKVEGVDFTDIFENLLEQKKLRIISMLSPREYERFFARNSRLKKFFEAIEAEEPAKQEGFEILLDAANSWEKRKNLIITIPALRKILDGSARYITDTPFPEKALELLDSVVVYEDQYGKDKIITIDDVNKILAEKTGVSFARLTASEKKKLTQLEEIIHQRLIGQNMAVNLISKILRAKAVGVVDTKRPIGSFLFLGPTGVGKTETAKVLAKVYFGSQKEILRFDMAEYAGREGLERLIGSAQNNQPGALTTAIKKKPSALLLLDEIEKAPPEVFNLFLTLLDEGSITDVFGRKIIGSNLFIVATTNAGAEYIRRLVDKGTNVADLQNKVINHVLSKRIFSPEFVNRFDGAVVYEPLTKENLIIIARLLLEELAQNLKAKNIMVSFDDTATHKLATDGYSPAFGARPMRRIIETDLGDLISKALLSEKISEGDKVRIYVDASRNFSINIE